MSDLWSSTATTTTTSISTPTTSTTTAVSSEWITLAAHGAHTMSTPPSAYDWQDFLNELKASDCAKLYGTNLVVGRGSLTPKIVFVGEAPGAEEDAQKLPFVGRSGQMLDEWIKYCGLTENDFYITNVVKTRPPENRDPTPDEVALCSPLLHKQLALLKPQYIVAVGRFAMNFFFPNKKSILKESGKLDGNVFIIPHPSYFLRNGGKGWEPYVNKLSEALGKKPSSTSEQQTLTF